MIADNFAASSSFRFPSPSAPASGPSSLDDNEIKFLEGFFDNVPTDCFNYNFFDNMTNSAELGLVWDGRPPPYNTYATTRVFAADSDSLAGQGPDVRDTMIFNPGMVTEYPNKWTVLATNSPLEDSPSLEGQSPRYVQDFPNLVEQPPYTITGDRINEEAYLDHDLRK